MKKRYIVYLAIAASLGIGYYVWYLLDTVRATNFINYVIDIMNRPLPIVGVTVAAVLVFVFKVIVSINYGKKRIGEYEANMSQMKEDYETFKQFIEEEKNKLAKLNDETRNQLATACQLSTNKKIKDFGKELNHEETINSETKAE